LRGKMSTPVAVEIASLPMPWLPSCRQQPAASRVAVSSDGVFGDPDALMHNSVLRSIRG
jgi:hypothetical protein